MLYLRVKTKNSGDHEVPVGEDEPEAKQALERARIELARCLRGRPKPATFEDRVVVPAQEVTSLEIFEKQLPRGASAGDMGEPTITRDMKF